MRRYQSISFNLQYAGKQLKIFASPVPKGFKNNIPSKFNIHIDDVNMGFIISGDNKWHFDRDVLKQELADAIGEFITKWYE